MSSFVSAALLARIAYLLRSQHPNAPIEALILSSSLPEPEPAVFSQVPNVLFDIGFSLERIERNSEAISTYRRALMYPSADRQLAGGAWFRIALLSNRLGNWMVAAAAYRRALDLAPEWAYMATLARYHLAGLLAADEEYAEAGALYEAVEIAPAHPDIPAGRVLLESGRCLFLTSQFDRAQEKLERILALFPHESLVVEANRLLADIYEQNHNANGAIACYQSIVANPIAEPALKAAALHRISALEGRKMHLGYG